MSHMSADFWPALPAMMPVIHAGQPTVAKCARWNPVLHCDELTCSPADSPASIISTGRSQAAFTSGFEPSTNRSSRSKYVYPVPRPAFCSSTVLYTFGAASTNRDDDCRSAYRLPTSTNFSQVGHSSLTLSRLV